MFLLLWGSGRPSQFCLLCGWRCRHWLPSTRLRVISQSSIPWSHWAQRRSSKPGSPRLPLSLHHFRFHWRPQSLSQISLPPQSLPNWRNLANYNRGCPSPFRYPRWTSISFFCEYIALPFFPPGTFVCPASFHDTWQGTDLGKHIFLHQPQMFEPPQMLEQQHVPNKYSFSSWPLLSDWIPPSRDMCYSLYLLAATIFCHRYSFCPGLRFCKGWTRQVAVEEPALSLYSHT